MSQCGDYEDIHFYVLNEFYGIVIAVYFLPFKKNHPVVVLRVCVYLCLCCAVLSAGGHVSVAWPGVSRGDRRCAGRRACAHRPTHGGVYKGRPADLRSDPPLSSG